MSAKKTQRRGFRRALPLILFGILAVVVSKPAVQAQGHRVIVGYRCRRCGRFLQSRAYAIRHAERCTDGTLPSEQLAAVRREANRKAKRQLQNELIKAAREACRAERDLYYASHGSSVRSRESDESGARTIGATVRRPSARPGDVTVVLKNVPKFVGRLLSESKKSITIKTPYGAEITFQARDVKEVTGGDRGSTD